MLNHSNPQHQTFRAIIYVDGFNLYYGCLKKSAYKWLNLEKLGQLLLGKNYEISKIKYFTAKAIDYKHNGVTTRQAYYLKALQTITKIEVIYGKFKQREKSIFIDPPLDVVIHPGTAPIKKSIFKGASFEEKGTDVNLATQLLIDLYEERFDCALIISNDTDYKMAVQQVKKKGKTIFIINTRLNSQPDIELRKVSHTHTRKLTEDILKKAQFPDVVHETLRKPKKWES